MSGPTARVLAASAVTDRLYDLLDNEEPPTLGMAGRAASWPLSWALNTVDAIEEHCVIVRREDVNVPHVQAVELLREMAAAWHDYDAEDDERFRHWEERMAAAVAQVEALIAPAPDSLGGTR